MKHSDSQDLKKSKVAKVQRVRKRMCSLMLDKSIRTRVCLVKVCSLHSKSKVLQCVFVTVVDCCGELIKKRQDLV